MCTLTLSLKQKWFDMIKSGIKLEEYREIKPFWIKRFLNKKYDKLVFTLGYPNANDMTRRLIFKNPKITVKYGKPEWGALPNRLYYVITWDNA